MTGLIWSSALCGALASAALPHACARTTARLRPHPHSGRTSPALAGRAADHRWPLLAGAGGAVVSAGIAWQMGGRHGGPLLVAVWLVVLYAGVLLAVVDIATRRLPTPVIGVAALAAGIALVCHALATGQTRVLATALLAAGVLGGGYLLLAIVGGSAVGLGDVRLAALLGAALGALGWPAVLYGGLLPYVLAAPEALTRLKLRRPHDLAFGPYLLAGALLAIALADR
ncbi:prepilin peptidase [Salinispora arenicola]|uniref:prepilin peptidase n=1 Tax=Salinispora arenicola TaxID=168697 RepID=UPI000369849B|nr:prepilin peptidase [Salinispora arenicola]